MLDWKNRATNSPDGAAKTSGGGRSGGSLIARALGGLIGVYLLIALVVVAVACAIVPYVLIRGPVTRLARIFLWFDPFG